MWAQASETAVQYMCYTIQENISYWEISNGNVEWSRDEELGLSTCV